MVFVKECGNGERGDDRASAERILMIGKGRAHAVEYAKPCSRDYDGDAGGEQRDDQVLAFDVEQRDQIGGRNRERDHARPHRAARLFRHGSQTRSLIFSRIRPVGRQAMMAMTTAKANTSL